MKAFKLYFQILRRYIPGVAMYTVIFLAISVGAYLAADKGSSQGVEMVQVPMTIFNEDDHPISKELEAYLKSNVESVELVQEEKAIDDALFYERVSYVLTIPKGFGEAFARGEEGNIPLVKRIGMSEQGYGLIDNLIALYMNSLETYRSAYGGTLPREKVSEVVGKVTENLETSVEVSYLDKENSQEKSRSFFEVNLYFNYMIYVIYAMLIKSIGSTMMSMERPEVKWRDVAGPFPEGQRTFQIMLANFVFSIVIWGINVVAGAFIFGPEILLETRGILLIISSFIHLMAVISLSVFIVTLLKTENSISFASTFVSLFVAFSSGIFIPMEFVFAPLRKITSFLPAIWHVRANEIIVESSRGFGGTWGEIQGYVLIQLAMVACFFLLTLAVRRHRMFEGR